MTTYYIRKDGSDANTGTANTSGGAWRTLEHARAEMAAGDEVLLAEDIYWIGDHTAPASPLTATGNDTPVVDFSGSTLPTNPTSLIGEYCIFRSGDTEGYRIVSVDAENDTITVERNYPAGSGYVYIADLMNPSHATPFTWDVAGVATTNVFSVLGSVSASARATIRKDPLMGNVSSVLWSGDVANQLYRDVIFDGDFDNSATYGPLLFANTAASRRAVVVQNCKFQNGGGSATTNDGQLRISNDNVIALILDCEFTGWVASGTRSGYGLYFFRGNGAVIGCNFHDATCYATSAILGASAVQSIAVENCIISRVYTPGAGSAVGINCQSTEGLICRNNTIYDIRSGSGEASGISVWSSTYALLWQVCNNIIAGVDGYPLDYGLKIYGGNTGSVFHNDYNWLTNCDDYYNPDNLSGAHDVTGIDPRLRDPAGGDFTPLNMRCYRAGKPDWNGTPTPVGAIARPTQARRMSGAFNSNICGVF